MIVQIEYDNRKITLQEILDKYKPKVDWRFGVETERVISINLGCPWCFPLLEQSIFNKEALSCKSCGFQFNLNEKAQTKIN